VRAGRPATSSVARPPEGLASRYSPDDLTLFDADERERFLAPFGALVDDALAGDVAAWQEIAPAVAWELLYRKEPELWQRLVACEPIHPDVLARLPETASAIELAAGTGRLTFDLAQRSGRVVAVEPVRAFRGLLADELARRGLRNVEVIPGFFDDVDAPDDSAELVVSCASFTRDPSHGGEPGLAEMQRLTRPGGMIALVWPADVDWLRAHGFTYESFDGEMAMEFTSYGEAVELARIFFPSAVEAIVERRSAAVPYELIGVNPPRDIAWKLVA
jgi:SAM-dependent methyltransferase